MLCSLSDTANITHQKRLRWSHFAVVKLQAPDVDVNEKMPLVVHDARHIQFPDQVEVQNLA